MCGESRFDWTVTRDRSDRTDSLFLFSFFHPSFFVRFFQRKLSLPIYGNPGVSYTSYVLVRSSKLTHYRNPESNERSAILAAIRENCNKLLPCTNFCNPMRIIFGQRSWIIKNWNNHIERLSIVLKLDFFLNMARNYWNVAVRLCVSFQGECFSFYCWIRLANWGRKRKEICYILWQGHGRFMRDWSMGQGGKKSERKRNVRRSQGPQPADVLGVVSTDSLPNFANNPRLACAKT